MSKKKIVLGIKEGKIRVSIPLEKNHDSIISAYEEAESIMKKESFVVSKLINYITLEEDGE